MIWVVYSNREGKNMAELNELDKKLLEHFRGYVVRKDLVRSVKVGANVDRKSVV